jgi:hypothetical protein
VYRIEMHGGIGSLPKGGLQCFAGAF